MKSSTLVFAKGVADIGIGLILFAKPAMLYESVATKALASLTGLVRATFFPLNGLTKLCP
jgi:hypothetical protein